MLLEQRLNQQLQARDRQGLTRILTAKTTNQAGMIIQQEKQWVNFASNDYLGLAQDPTLISAWKTGLERYGAGSSASPLVVGFTPAHQHLESTLCDWLGFDRAILFNSGFSANQALLFSLPEKGDWIIQDKLNHASLMEAGVLSPAQMTRFRHNDINHLKIKLNNKSNALVITEGIFSMDGDSAPLAEIQTLCQQYAAGLVVDDAHGLGVQGEQGQGSCFQAKVKPNILIVTFGKALGVSGAAILCNATVGDYLTQFARHHVYSTAMPPSQAYAITQAIEMVKAQSWRREKLAELSDTYQQAMKNTLGYTKSCTPIKPYICGESSKALALSDYLQNKGLWASAIRPPTVAKHSARLRITLTVNHTVAQVKQLTEAIHRYEEQTH